MRALVHDFPGHPFQVQLSRELAGRGHRVLHAFSPDVPAGRGALSRRSDDPQTFDVVPVPIGRRFERYSPFRRSRDEITYGRKLVALAAQFDPQVIVSANTPLLAQYRLRRWAGGKGISFVYWLQDLLGVGTAGEIRKRFGPLGALPAQAFRTLEARLLASSDAVVAISEDFGPYLRAAGAAMENTHVIENWAPLGEIPVRSRDNEWARRHGLTDKLVFLYSGTLGLKHDPGMLLELARKFQASEGVVICVVSEAIGADWLRDHAAKEGLRSLKVFPYQPYDQLPDLLASGDVLIALLEPGPGLFSVPSKLLSYFCAGRPILAAMPSDNLAARNLRRSEAGLMVSPGDVPGFLAAADQLINGNGLRTAMGKKGRRYAERTFAVERIGDEFESVLTKVI